MNNRIFASLPPLAIAAIFVLLRVAYHGIFEVYFPNRFTRFGA